MLDARTALFVLCLTTIAAAQEAKKVLTLGDYGAWRRVTSTQLAPDGKWATFAYVPNDGDAELHVRELDGDRDFAIRGGSRPAFAASSRFVAYMIDPPEKEAAKLRAKKAPVVRACEVRDLAKGTTQKFAGASSFTFAKSGRYVAIVKSRADAKAKHKGADLLVVFLDDGRVQNLGNVTEFAFNESGTLLAYVVDAADQAGNGIYLWQLGSGQVTALDTSARRYSRLSWGKERDDLTCLRGGEVKGKEQRANDVLAFLGLPNGARHVVYAPSEDAGFPKNHVVSEYRGPTFSQDGKRLFVGLRAQRAKIAKPKKKPAAKSTKRSNVEVWHWKDERVQSVQKVRAAQDRRRTHLGVLHLDDKPRLVRLANAKMPTVLTAESGAVAIGRDDSAYRGDMTAARGRADYYRIDLATGQRKRFAKSVRRMLGLSPDGAWFLFSRDGVVFAYETATGKTHNLSKASGVDFTNEEADRPSEKGTYGLAGWVAGGGSVVLNHRFDLWHVPLSGEGKARNLTRGLGAKERIRFRYVRLDPEEKAIDLGGPLVLSAYGDRTKRSGYYRLDPKTGLQPLYFADKMIGGLQRAKHAKRFLFTQQTVVESPDLWGANAALQKRRKLSTANPQQAKFRWTPGRVLLDYKDARGNELQATLTLPAGYQKGKRYPMLVYFYEKMSQRHHQYSMPRYDDRPHMSTYASDGYLVLMPDIVYSDGKPGSSALDDVGAAVRKAIELGYADPKRIGLQGHSWGGYQSSFIVTQTDMFACVVTGAPLTNLVSMHNVLYKRTGNPNAGLIEWGQGRMATNPWKNLKAYLDQSPVHHAHKIKTPFMILHGTADGAVDWNQGLEFYIAAKRLGKQVILLSYPDEPHHLRRKENQKDFQRRMKQYFDHYLKGAKAPVWLKKGLPYGDREREKRG